MPNRSAQALWDSALGQLELQVTRPNFETWLRNTVGLGLEGDCLTVGVPSDFALEWLRSRMNSLISRTVSHVLGTQVRISFEVLGARPAPSLPHSNTSPAQAPAGYPAPELNPALTFESFTVVTSNRLAHRAARRVATGDRRYNPLVMFGAHGLGKTHLLHAIGHAAAAAGSRVVQLTDESFVDRFAKAVRAGQPQSFRDLFQGCGIFLLDDVRLLETRSASQDQFYHLFNNLQAAGCQLVLAIDAYPDAISRLSSRLRSRLQAGLAVELTPPTADDRLAIVQAKARHLATPLAETIIRLIAQEPHTTVRQLEGALNRVVAYADLSGDHLSLEAARKALFPLQPPHQPPTADAILDTVSRHFHISRDLLASPSRARDITYARHIAMYLLRSYGSRPLAAIGHLFGDRDHSTVLSAYNRIHQEITALPQTRADIDSLQAILHADPAA